MRKYIVLLILICLLQKGNTQEGFIKPFNFQHQSAVRFTSFILDNDTLLLGGIIKDTLPPYEQGFFLSKVDTTGEILKTKIYFDSTANSYTTGGFPGNLIKTLDSTGYVFAGNIFETSAGFLIKTDNELNRVWERQYEDGNASQSFYKQLIETEDGFIIVGEKQKTSGQIDHFLLKTDQQGNKLWERNYVFSDRNDYLDSFLKVNNNEYILGGYIGPSTAINASWEDWHHQIQIFAVDSLGNEKWRWESDPPMDMWSEEDMGCVGLHRDGDGNWVYATRRGEHNVVNGFYQYTNTQAEFVVRDSNFNMIVQQVYEEIDGPTNGFLNMIQLSDGDWLGVGVNLELGEHNYAWMNRISNGQDGMTDLGDSLWTRNDVPFSDSSFVQLNYLHSAVELPSGSIIAAGYFDGFGNNPDQGLLIKVNQHGCVDTVDCIPTNFPNIMIATKEIVSPDLNVYPNPARHILHYESEQVQIWDKVELLDMTGRVMSVVFNNKEITLNGLPPGIYVLRLWKDGQFWTRKVVKQ